MVWAEGGSGAKELMVKPSLSSSVEAADLDGREHVRDYATVGDLMAVYEEVNWGELTEHADAVLVPTCMIASTVVKKVGKLEFGNDAECKASFTFWRNETDQTALASEFSYSCDNSGGAFADAEDTAKAVFEKLIEDEFVNPKPDTKTAIAYRCAPN